MFSETKPNANPASPFSNAPSRGTGGTSTTYEIPDPSELLTEPGRRDPATNKPTIDLSFSSCKEINYCPRKYQLRKRFYQPDYPSSDEFLAAASGTAIHEYIQSRLRGEDHEIASLAFFMGYSFHSEITASDYNLRYRTLEPAYQTAQEAAETILASSGQLADFITTDDDGNEIHIPGTEFKFSIVFRNDDWKNTYIYRGAIDVVTTSQSTFSATDIKTHRNTIEDLTAEYKFSPQLVPYGLVIQHLTNKPVSEFTVNYLSIFVDLLEPKVVPYSFSKTQDDVDAWLQSTLLTIANIESYHEQSVWPRTQSGCMAYRQPCKYLSLCHHKDGATVQEEILRGGKYPPKAPSTLTPHVTIDLQL